MGPHCQFFHHSGLLSSHQHGPFNSIYSILLILILEFTAANSSTFHQKPVLKASKSHGLADHSHGPHFLVPVFRICYFSSSCDSIPDEARRKHLFRLRVGGLQSLLMRKMGQQRREVLGHIASTSRKQKATRVGAHLALSFLFEYTYI